MSENPTHNPREDSPDAGAPPVGQVPGKTDSWTVVSVSDETITYNIDGLSAGPWITVSEWDLFPPGDPSEPFPADDEQDERRIWDRDIAAWTAC